VAFHQAVPLGIGLKMINRLPEGNAGLRGQLLAHAVAKFRVRVDSGPDSGSTNR